MATSMVDLPDITVDEAKKGFIRVKLETDGLKAAVKGSEHQQPEATNAEILHTKFHSRGFTLSVKWTDGERKKDLTYTRRKTPFEIVPEKSYMTIANDKIFLLLKKKDNSSWSTEISSGYFTMEEVD
ncbi:uncharacterized protein LOC131940567 [Physella acuta]|uniref:uncharacterized protein LOC131940567 n=1 Tax=Physella acuta TaxID=109671 RepID=UPI0027DE56DA|nr:uncharacterized protein LOC131940567 [Physella acuta]